MSKPDGYYSGVNRKLYDLIPPSSNRILELGCAKGNLGRLYKENNPNATWIGIDIADDALAVAANHLDAVLKLDLNQQDLEAINTSNKFDAIVIGDLLEHLINPERILSQLYNLSTDEAKIICCLPNMAHISVIERLITGDISYDDMGLLDKTHLRFFSHSSAFKLFLDSGWLPHLSDQYRTSFKKTSFTKSIINAATSLGLPFKTAVRNLNMYQMLIECSKWPHVPKGDDIENIGISVVVPVNRVWEYELNIARSPGLKEIPSELIPIKKASSAADAFSQGRAKAKYSWILFIHQDVYIPKGAGLKLLSEIKTLEAMGTTSGPVGFAGLSDHPKDTNKKYAGLVVDRTKLFNHTTCQRAISLDEFAVVLHKNSRVTIDPLLGWHTWGTDLCLQALNNSNCSPPIILSIPFFHNSLNDGELNENYYSSAKQLLKKYLNTGVINTLCGAIERSSTTNFSALNRKIRSQIRKIKVAAKRKYY